LGVPDNGWVVVKLLDSKLEGEQLLTAFKVRAKARLEFGLV
jgi:hypothetical protein